MRLLSTVLAAFLCSGCFVVDELDAGMDLLDQHSPVAKADEPSPEPEEAPAKRSRKGPGLLQQLQKWWVKVTRPARPAPDPNDVLVKCEMGSSTLFTRKSDCLARRGKPIVLASDDEAAARRP